MSLLTRRQDHDQSISVYDESMISVRDSAGLGRIRYKSATPAKYKNLIDIFIFHM
jgi:hypothetical protein